MKAGPPLRERRERDVEKTDLKHDQERERQILAVAESVANEIAEINREPDFDNGQERLQRHVTAGAPGLRSVLDPVFGSALEFRMMIEDGLEHGAGVVDRKADPERD